MASTLPTMLREIHRLRRYIRDLQAEAEDGPRVLKARKARVTKVDDAVKLAHDTLKQRKAHLATLELNLKSAHQQLGKYQKQLGEMQTQTQTSAKETEIKFTENSIAQLEAEILNQITIIDEKAAEIPKLEHQAANLRADFQVHEQEAKEKLATWTSEIKAAETKLAQVEAKIPDAVRINLNRLIKIHGADGLASVKDLSCGNCRRSITGQQEHEMATGIFTCCSNCGRALYPAA